MSSEQNNKGFSSSVKKAQTGHAVATILNGALTGGLKGAAIATAKSFSPQIISFLISAIVLCVLLPFFLFLSLVGTSFQFPSVDNSDVVKLNAQAVFVSGLYSQFSVYTRAQADSIIASLSVGYDEVVVTESFGNTNDYWLTAISSVYHDQDLYRITEDSVKAIIKANIDYSYEVETYTETDDEGNEYSYSIIYISVWDIGQAALIKRLEFNEFQKQWAGFLYQNVADMQVVDPLNPSYDGDMPGIEYGNLSFSDGSCEVVYYNQMDSRWCNEMYGKTQSIGYAGCGPTAMAMVISSLTSNTVTPKDMADWSVENGYCCEGNGSYHSLIPAAAKAFGLSVEGIGKAQPQKVLNALADGKLVVAIMAPGHFTTTGHFLVLRGVTSEGKILVADPVSYNKSQKEWDANIIFQEARGNSGANGPFWVIS